MATDLLGPSRSTERRSSWGIRGQSGSPVEQHQRGVGNEGDPGGPDRQPFDESQHPDHHGGIDIDAGALVIEAHIAPGDGWTEAQARRGHPVTGGKVSLYNESAGID